MWDVVSLASFWDQEVVLKVEKMQKSDIARANLCCSMCWTMTETDTIFHPEATAWREKVLKNPQNYGKLMCCNFWSKATKNYNQVFHNFEAFLSTPSLLGEVRSSHLDGGL